MNPTRKLRPILDRPPQGSAIAWTLFFCSLSCLFWTPGALARDLCSTPGNRDSEVAEDFKKHVILVDVEGDLRDPCTFEKLGAGNEMHRRREEERLYLENIRQHLGEQKPKKILIFIHGGLNRKTKSSRRVISSYQQIKEDGIYPIFINWSSGPLTNFLGAFVRERRGERIKTSWGLTAAPYHLGRGFVEGIGHTPTTWWRMWASDKASLSADPLGPLGRLDELQAQQDKDSGVPVVNVLTYPFGMIFAPIVDGLGDPLYQSMTRRVDSQFYGMARSGTGDPGPEVGAWHRGGTSRLLDVLAEYQESDLRVELTIVGHSMGAMVVGNVLRLFGDRLNIRNIVFMGAASSLGDLETAVAPYLAKQHSRGFESDFYNLMLHRVREHREINFGGMAPRGSLLVWIDNMFESDLGPMYRTAGRTVNFVRYLGALSANQGAIENPVFEAALERMSFRRFEPIRLVGHRECRREIRSFHRQVREDFQRGIVLNRKPPGCQAAWRPQRHGDFSLGQFWRPEYWTHKAVTAADLLEEYKLERAMNPEKWASSDFLRTSSPASGTSPSRGPEMR